LIVENLIVENWSLENFMDGQRPVAAPGGVRIAARDIAIRSRG
jgi:hypothetical protein